MSFGLEVWETEFFFVVAQLGGYSSMHLQTLHMVVVNHQRVLFATYKL